MTDSKQAFIHPMAVVERGAELGAGVHIGPFCHVSAGAQLGDNVDLASHVAILGTTIIGAGTKVFPQAVLGAPPQNAKHTGGPSRLIIGANCTIREGATMHAGTDSSRAETRVGDNGNFLAYTHIAHDCIVGDNVTFANGATLGGHCEIGNFVNIGGLTAIHQFVRVGDRAFVGGFSGIVGDVIPYGIVSGSRAKLRGLNIVGMKRSGMSRPDIHALRAAYRVIFDRTRPLAENLEAAKTQFEADSIAWQIISFMNSKEKRQFTVPPVGGLADDGSDDDD
ncbi:acyl-ACP--UDP-N-acetylglucosamine O-acyltransferase [Mesorhizobium sp. NBSH29]|uniref:acyl-ACP--UDP-N-acetylglucosamine O-acyltransferase n=1 Tax=Mesorhizobium sp. NBSH29 TaxID=2654249 RepID=UPI001896591B|nr:acyl-ACP--UDP-N-acetylglucosamine O-acyltransferase [Mesorhizobium sp. NBSH29]QPC87693.1 acyl-ACP--UDP-N-acetylglucosamine O-acyltransferase [Mesorhizobium sp. NBSH29]